MNWHATMVLFNLIICRICYDWKVYELFQSIWLTQTLNLIKSPNSTNSLNLLLTCRKFGFNWRLFPYDGEENSFGFILLTTSSNAECTRNVVRYFNPWLHRQNQFYIVSCITSYIVNLWSSLYLKTELFDGGEWIWSTLESLKKQLEGKL